MYCRNSTELSFDGDAGPRVEWRMKYAPDYPMAALEKIWNAEVLLAMWNISD